MKHLHVEEIVDGFKETVKSRYDVVVSEKWGRPPGIEYADEYTQADDKALLDLMDMDKVELGDEKKARKKANDALHALTTNKYFSGVPASDIKELLNKFGFNGAAMDGIYTGREGKLHEQVGPKTWISMTWYKMEGSGKYEIVTYLS